MSDVKIIDNGIKAERIAAMKSKIPYADVPWRSEENADLWILDIFNQKRGGTFIEAGAAGRSNCRNLELYYDWRGVCIEPCAESAIRLRNQDPYDQLFENRRKNVIEKCLYSYNGVVDFYECCGKIYEETGISNSLDPWDAAHLSSVLGKTRPFHLKYVEKYGTVVKKECLTLEQVILDNGLPDTIDYLSIDIENSEEEVFRVFPFDKYRFLTIQIEEGDKHAKFLFKNGYLLVNNPYYRYEPWVDYFFIHRSIADSYPHDILDYREYV